MNQRKECFFGIRIILGVLVFIFPFLACAPIPYTTHALKPGAYGWSANQVSRNQFIVKFTERFRAIHGVRVSRHDCFLRAAEIAIENGFPYFVVLDEKEPNWDKVMTGFVLRLYVGFFSDKYTRELKIEGYSDLPPLNEKYILDTKAFIKKFPVGSIWANIPSEPYSFLPNQRVKLYDGPDKNPRDAVIFFGDGKVIVTSADGRILRLGGEFRLETNPGVNNFVFDCNWVEGNMRYYSKAPLEIAFHSKPGEIYRTVLQKGSLGSWSVYFEKVLTPV